ncbi:MAG: VWA domain-containing protein [Flavobacteriales bacterium]|nr:VWA domain-containing protein [Flavobacteriales bacterium]
MKDITFAYPWVFLALLLIPVLVFLYFSKLRHARPALILSSLPYIPREKAGLRSRLVHVPFFLRLLTLAVIITALARPQSSLSQRSISTEGIDIVVAMDISSSMLARDFKPDRLESSKRLASEFIERRPNDRIGLVVFAGESFTQCPLTTDHSILINRFGSIRVGLLQDGTAIGLGLANAVNRLRSSEAKSKVVILLTDGVNNSGSITPETATELAETMGVRVYTIGVGTKGMAYGPIGQRPDGKVVFDMVPVEIDEKVLGSIADNTGGQYFRAQNENELRTIYKQIDQLEKSKIDVTEFTEKGEEFLPLALLAIGLLLAEFILSQTLFRSTP